MTALPTLPALLKNLHLLIVGRPCPERSPADAGDDAAQAALASDAPAAETAASADHPCGCGWFDSSHDLQCGLRVQELATPEALAQLPLGSWLDLELGTLH